MTLVTLTSESMMPVRRKKHDPGVIYGCRDLSYNNFYGEIPYNIGYLQVSTL